MADCRSARERQKGESMSQTFIIPPENRERIADNLRAFVMQALPGKRLRVEVSEHRKRRSDDQNRYLWGVAYKTLRDATGQEAEDWHEYMLGEWAGWEEYELFGRKRLRPTRRSSKLSTVEFADYVAFVQQRAAENGIYIPDPNELRKAA
jgi:hypothetical protein